VTMADERLRVSIGICAWNEERTIDAAISTIFRQDIFSKGDDIECIEVVVLANDCVDATASIAHEAFKRELARCEVFERVRVNVAEVPWGGKARAMNVLTHELSDPQAHYLISMDADVEIIEPYAVRALLTCLQQDRNACIAVPVCRKHVEIKRNPTMIDRFSVAASSLAMPGDRVPLSGALYCGRGDALRQMWQPIGPRGADVGTDVFVRDMVVTDQWRKRDRWQDELILRVPDATVVFEAYAGVREMLFHQKRRAISNVNRLILHDFLSQHVDERGASDLIKRMNELDGDWFRNEIETRLRVKRWWVLPRPLLQWSRIARLGGRGLLQQLTQLPVAIVAEIIDLYASLAANREFKAGTYSHVWRMDR
jgi:glycosyltransferase involved in cell wall biosynthesis